MDRPLMPGQRVRVLVDMWGNADEPGRPATVLCQMVGGEFDGMYHVRYNDRNPKREAVESILPASCLIPAAATPH